MKFMANRPVTGEFDLKSVTRRLPWIYLGLGVLLTTFVVAVTLAIGPSNEWIDPVLATLGLIAALWIAYLAHLAQAEIQLAQAQLSTFLYGRVDSRKQRTQEAIKILMEAKEQFTAVTAMPSVGIRDAPSDIAGSGTPDHKVFCNELEKKLDSNSNFSAKIVSLSRDASLREYVAKETDSKAKHAQENALNTVSERFMNLQRNYPDRFEWNVFEVDYLGICCCQNESRALVYELDLNGEDDVRGYAILSADDRIHRIATRVLERRIERCYKPA